MTRVYTHCFRRDSPTQGHLGASGMPISTMLSASHRKPDNVELTPSLINYYDSRLTGHVTGWPGDQVEKQVSRVRIGPLKTSELQNVFSRVLYFKNPVINTRIEDFYLCSVYL